MKILLGGLIVIFGAYACHASSLLCTEWSDGQASSASAKDISLPTQFRINIEEGWTQLLDDESGQTYKGRIIHKQNPLIMEIYYSGYTLSNAIFVYHPYSHHYFESFWEMEQAEIDHSPYRKEFHDPYPGNVDRDIAYRVSWGWGFCEEEKP